MKAVEHEIWHISFRDGLTQVFIFRPPHWPPRELGDVVRGSAALTAYENVPLKAESYRCTIFSQETAEAWQR